MNKYIYHLASSVRRKKAVLMLAFVLILIIFGLHYNRSVEPIVGQILPNILKEAMDSNRVNFLNTNESRKLKPKEFLENNNKYESILADSEPFPNNLKPIDNIAPMESEQQLGIPFVNSFTKNPYIPKKRIVHLDLKGAPPLLPFYRRFFPFIRNLGATGILIEYEDMFPFDGILKNISARNAYTKEQIVEILNLAEESNLEVIPLVQTFGHLEFVLKLRDFQHLREVPSSPQAICPKRNGTLEYIKEMVNQESPY